MTALEAAWRGRVQVPSEFFGWEPYDLPAFMELLAAAMAAAPAGALFFDAGCGIGTKCLIAAQAGCVASGIDRVPEFVTEARRLGVDAQVADVRDWDYSPYGIVYVNHPLACGPGCDDEAVLEHRVHESMAPGAALISVNYDLAPGCSVHGPDVPCTEACPHAAAAWREIARLGAWAAAWAKP